MDAYLWTVRNESMKKILFILSCVFAIAFCACKQTSYTKPDELISHEKMVDILYDIHLNEAIQKNKKFSADSVDFSTIDLHFSILKKHEIQDSLFIQSVLYYSSLPKVYERIYQDVVNKLSILEQENEKKEPVNINPKREIH